MLLLWKIDNFIDTVNGQHSFLVCMVRNIVIAALSGAVDDFNKQDTAYSKEFQIETRWWFHHYFCWCICNPFGGMFWKDFETCWFLCLIFSSATPRNKTTTSRKSMTWLWEWEMWQILTWSWLNWRRDWQQKPSWPWIVHGEFQHLGPEFTVVDQIRVVEQTQGLKMVVSCRKSIGKSEDRPGWFYIVLPDGWRSPPQFLIVVPDLRNCKSVDQKSQVVKLSICPKGFVNSHWKKPCISRS